MSSGSIASIASNLDSKEGLQPYLRPHLLQPGPDGVTRYLHSVLPVSIQTYLRDKGLFRSLMDNSVKCLALITALTNANIARDFIAISSKVKSIRYGHSDSHLIEYINISEYCASKKSKSREAKILDLVAGANSNVPSGNRSVLIFVHGGAWGSGQPWMYRLTAANAAMALGFSHVCLVGYPVYPESSIQEQADAVVTSLGAISDYFHEQRINCDNYLLMGHSSGANISALALLKLARSKFKIVDYFIALSGVFDIARHLLWEANRGVHLISPMGAASLSAATSRRPKLKESTSVPADGKEPSSSDNVVINNSTDHIDHKKPPSLNAFKAASPLTELESFYSSNGSSLASFLPNSLIIHGIDDNTVPVSDSIQFSKALMHLGVDTSTSFPMYDHMNPITDLLDSSKALASPTGASLSYYREHKMNLNKSSEKGGANMRSKL